MRKILILIFSLFILSGCAQSVRQHSNMLNAMNGKLTPINYTKTYIFTMFGYPDSKKITVSKGVCKEIWTYTTKLGYKDTLFNMRPWKTRYMKVTIVNNLVTDVSFE